jgi:hypothetical protein
MGLNLFGSVPRPRRQTTTRLRFALTQLMAAAILIGLGLAALRYKSTPGGSGGRRSPPSPAEPIDKQSPQQDRVRGCPSPVASRQALDMTLDRFDRDHRERESQAEARRDRACTRPARGQEQHA